MEHYKDINIFSVHGRINRKTFAKVYLAGLVFETVCLYIDLCSQNLKLMLITLIMSYLIYIITIPLNIRRLHDSNLSGFFLIIGFIPVVVNVMGTNIIIMGLLGGFFGILNLYLIFRKSTDGKNRYGNNQARECSEKKINLLCIGILIISIMVIGVNIFLRSF